MNLGFSEIAMIFLVALVLFGPEKLPELARVLGKVYREMRKASAELNYHMHRTVGELEDGQAPSASLRDLADKLDLRKHLTENPARAAFGGPAPAAAEPLAAEEPPQTEESSKPSTEPVQ